MSRFWCWPCEFRSFCSVYDISSIPMPMVKGVMGVPVLLGPTVLRIPKWKSKKRSRMTYGKFCGQRVAPLQKKTHKKNHRRNQLQSTTRRRNSETECNRHVATLGIHSMWQTWQNTFFFPECGAATGSFQRFSTNMVGMFPKESQ